MSYLSALDLPGNVSYCYVSRSAAENFVAGAGPARMTVDSVNFVSADFVVAPGDDHVGIITPGTYLSMADVYPSSAPLASGELRALIGGNLIFSTGVVCDASLSDNGAGLAFGFSVIASASPGTPATVYLSAAQSDSVDRDLSGDLLIIRLPGNSA